MNCNDPVADCDPSQLSLDKTCVPYTVTDSYYGNFPNYISLTQDYDWDVIKEDTYSNPYSCIADCNLLKTCGAVRYDSKSGQCKLLDTSKVAKVIDRSDEKDSCMWLFQKDPSHPGPNDCLSTNPSSDCYNASVKLDDDHTINVVFSQATPASSRQKIQSDSRGGDCRKQVADGDIPDNSEDVL